MSSAIRSRAGVNRPRRRRASRLPSIATYAVLTIVAFGSLYPLVLMINASLRSNVANATNPSGLAISPVFDGYRELIVRGGLLAFGNSVLVAVVTTVVAVFLCALAAYALTKLRFLGRKAIFLALLATIMVPIQTAIPGFFAAFSSWGWINSYQVQILPFITPVFGLFMIRQYLLGIPDSFIEAGRLDGAGEFRIFWQIIIPVIRPILAAFGVLQLLAMWNSYVWPKVMADAADVATLAVALPKFTDPTLGLVPLIGAMMAGSVLMTVPLIIVFLLNQDAFMKGVSFGSK